MKVHQSLIKIGVKNNNPRIWLENKLKLESSGFAPGVKFEISYEINKLTLHVDLDGRRKVSQKIRNNSVIPVLDINTNELNSIFKDYIGGKLLVRYFEQSIEINLDPATEAIKSREDAIKNKLSKSLNIDSVSLFTGSGFLDLAIKEGFAQQGIELNTLLAYELEEKYLDNGLKNNPALRNANSIAYGIEWVHRFNLPKSDILIAGYPCVGFSKAGKSKNQIKSELDHGTAGNLFIYMINAILSVNPAIIVIENVPEANNSITFNILESILIKAGYKVEKKIVNSWEFGCIEQRKRVIFLAYSNGLNLSLGSLKPPRIESKERVTLSQFLDSDIENIKWSSLEYFTNKEKRDKEQGKGFKMNLVTPESDRIGTLGKGYAKKRSTEPKLINCNNKNLYRLFTSSEHAKIKGFPPELVKNLPNTTAHEVLGNGVAAHPFIELGKLLGYQLIEIFSEKV